MKKITTLTLLAATLATNAFAHHFSTNFDWIDSMISAMSPHLTMTF